MANIIFTMLRNAVEEKKDTKNVIIVIKNRARAEAESRWKSSFNALKNTDKPRETKIADIIMPMNRPNGAFIDKAIKRKPIDPGNNEYDTAVKL